MLFSAKAEYAGVAMLELASRHHDPRPARLADIADKHGIPGRFLVQILLDLKRAGLVASTRGAAGGYALARPADEITMYDILNVIDPPEQHARADDPLQPTVLVFERSEALGLIDLESPVLLSPAVDGGFRHPMLAGQFPDGLSRRGLLQNPDDLVLSETRLVHQSLLAAIGDWDFQPIAWPRLRGAAQIAEP